MASSYIAALIIHLKEAWDMLIYSCFFHQCMPIEDPVNGQELYARVFDHQNKRYELDDDDELVDYCAVCLSTIGEDEEIRVLRCDHLFHKGCLDRCVEHRHTRCPLCRDVLAGPRRVCDISRELLYFSFCSTESTDDDCDRWWLR
ncbi:uncharacterized protein LOC143554828 [Bidens hawaiensis]|uniref:uncharacterized protein LOC143554828 n=1 Tax=Bidens hawaiensis TaxID=980011 RepID=UPI004049AAF0